MARRRAGFVARKVAGPNATTEVKKGQVWRRVDEPVCYYISAVYNKPSDIPSEIKIIPEMLSLFPVVFADLCDKLEGKICRGNYSTSVVLRASWFPECCVLEVEKCRRPKTRQGGETRPYIDTRKPF